MSAKTCVFCTSMYIENKTNLQNLFVKLRTRIYGANNQWRKLQIRKNYTIILAWLWRVWKSLYHCCTLNGKCVGCVCLQCGRCKQNHYRFLGKTDTIDKCAVSSRVDWPITDEDFKRNPRTVDKWKLKL